MAVETIIKKVKEIHKYEVAFVKIGKFYHVYGKDSCIISYLLNFKIQIKDGLYTCGFPENSLNKVKAKLEEKKISYLILDRKDNYNVDEIEDFKKLNNYQKVYEKAHEYVKLKIRAENIYRYMMQNLLKKETKNKMFKVEGILYND